MLEDRIITVCCECPSIRYKGEWHNLGDIGIEMIRSWGYSFSHSYCTKCYTKAMEEIENGNDTDRSRQRRR